MRVAIFSDVQANLPAMEEVVEHIEKWRPELVVLNGDLINRGPRNPECLNLFLELQQRVHSVPLRGNHEEYILHCAHHPPTDERDAALRQFADSFCGQNPELMPLTNPAPEFIDSILHTVVEPIFRLLAIRVLFGLERWHNSYLDSVFVDPQCLGIHLPEISHQDCHLARRDPTRSALSAGQQGKSIERPLDRIPPVGIFLHSLGQCPAALLENPFRLAASEWCGRTL